VIHRLGLLTGLLLVTVARAEPTQVFIGMHVVEMRTVDTRTESFYADLYLWLRFKNAGLSEERLTQIVERLEPVNGKFETKDLVDDKVVGEERYVCYRVTGSFFFVPAEGVLRARVLELRVQDSHPLLIILAMAWLVFFLPPGQLDTAASVAMTALLSCPREAATSFDGALNSTRRLAPSRPAPHQPGARDVRATLARRAVA